MVLAPVGPAARLGEEAEVQGEEAGVPGGVVGPVTGPEVLGVLTGPAVLVVEEAAELAEELQAVNRTATRSRPCRPTGARASASAEAVASLYIPNGPWFQPCAAVFQPERGARRRRCDMARRAVLTH